MKKPLSIHKKYLLSYFIVLLIPTILFITMIFSYYIKVLKNEINEKTLKDMDKINVTFEQNIKEMNNIVFQLTLDNDFSPFSFYEDPLKANNIKKQLDQYRATNEFVKEIVFYFREDPYIYSSTSSYTLDKFHKDIFKYEDWDFDEFYQTLNKIENPEFIVSKNMTRGDTYAQKYITYICPISRNMSPYATVMFIIPETSFRESMVTLFNHDILYSGIFKENNNELTPLSIVDSINFTISDELEATLLSAQENQLNDFVYNNQKYLLTYINKTDTSLRYLTLLPIESTMSVLSDIKLITCLGILAIFFLGSFFIYILFKINYKPVKKLIDLIKKNNSNCNGSCSLKIQDDFSYLYASFNKLAEDSQKLNNLLKHNKDALKEYIILNLLNGQIDKIDYFNKKSEDLGFTLKHEYYGVALITNKDSNIDNGKFKNAILSIESDVNPNIQGICKRSNEKNTIIFLFSTANKEETFLQKYFETLNHRLISTIDFSSLITIGQLCDDAYEIPKSYLSAHNALEFESYRNHTPIIFHRDFKTDHVNLNFYYHDYINKFNDAINLRNIEQIESIVSYIMSLLKENKLPFVQQKYIVFDMINILIKNIYKIDNLRSLEKDITFDIFKLAEFKNLEELEKQVLDLCYNLCATIDYTKNNPELIDSILDYIQENYAHPSFSVQKVADEFSLQPSNLSHYFKQCTGVTMLSHITNIRISKAKELLLSSDKPLSEIIQLIGYNDTSSFIRKFKKSEGITPGAYRKVN